MILLVLGAVHLWWLVWYGTRLDGDEQVRGRLFLFSHLLLLLFVFCLDLVDHSESFFENAARFGLNRLLSRLAQRLLQFIYCGLRNVWHELRLQSVQLCRLILWTEPSVTVCICIKCAHVLLTLDFCTLYLQGCWLCLGRLLFSLSQIFAACSDVGAHCLPNRYALDLGYPCGGLGAATHSKWAFEHQLWGMGATFRWKPYERRRGCHSKLTGHYALVTFDVIERALST